MTHKLPMQSLQQACRPCRIRLHSIESQLASSFMHRQPSTQGVVPSHLLAVNVTFPLPDGSLPQKWKFGRAWIHSIGQGCCLGPGETSFSTVESDHVAWSPIASLSLSPIVPAWLHHNDLSRLAFSRTQSGLCTSGPCPGPWGPQFPAAPSITCSSEIHPSLTAGVCELMYPLGAHAGLVVAGPATASCSLPE